MLISLLSLAAVFYFADPRQVVIALGLADYRLVLLAAGITLVWLVVRSMVWRTLLQERASLGQVFITVNEGYLINNVLPFRLGEIARAFLLSRKASLGFWQVFSTIILERAMDLVMAVGLLMALLPLVIGADWAYQAAVGVGLVVLVGLALLYLLARYQDWALAQFDRISKRWPILEKYGRRPLETFLAGLSVLTDLKHFLRAVAWIILNWLVAIFQYYALVKAFFPGGTILWGAFTLGIMALGIAAPSSPGAIGVMEASVVGALAVFQAEPSTALAMALTAHAINYILTGSIGFYGLIMDGMSITGVYRKVSEIAPDEPLKG